MSSSISDRPSAVMLHGATIYGHPQADALVIEHGRIHAIGRKTELEASVSAQIPRVDLHNGALLPGFIDAHIHLLHTGLVHSGWIVPLQGLSRASTLEALAAACSGRSEGEWVVGYGWDESEWSLRKYIERRELDRLSTRHPILAIRTDGHLLTANSAGLARLPDTVPQALVDREAGLLREEAVAAIRAEIVPDRDVAERALDAAAEYCHELGITAVHSMSGLGAPQYEAFMSGRERRRLRIRLCPAIERMEAFVSLGLRSDFGDSWVRFGGMKAFADGSIGAANAAISEPYGSGGRGALNQPNETMRAWIRRADESGWQTLVHAIGDRAIEQVLRLHEELKTDRGLRHRVEHLELPTKEQIERMQRLGLVASVQPNFTGNWSGEGKLYVDRLGAERDAQSNPLAWLLDAGIPVAFGSDGMPPGPLYGIHWAVNAPHAAQRISVSDAIACYTAGSAYAGFDEAERGMIESGMRADLVLLDEDPRLQAGAINDRVVMQTFVGGECVYAREESA